MAKWNTAQIKSDLLTVVAVTSIEVNEGEDSATEQVVITLGGCEDKLFARAFNGEYRIEEVNDIDLPMVELTDGLASGGGLNSKNFTVARAYIDVRQYFLNRGFEVVPTMDVYF